MINYKEDTPHHTIQNHRLSINITFLLTLIITLTTITWNHNQTLLVAANQPKSEIHSLINNNQNNNQKMGNVARMAKYDRAANVANAIESLQLQGHTLKWHRLDDGVMGGRSETIHANTKRTLDDGTILQGLDFTGTINTNGGGFTSIRAPLIQTTIGNSIRLKLRGDGKTYKLLLSDGNSSFMSGSPSWQVDIPTKPLTLQDDAAASEEITIPLSSLRPSFGGRPSNRPTIANHNYTFRMEDMKELGFMLSLRLSDGSPNPKETFGEGIFDFSLFVESIEFLRSSSATS